MSRAAWASALVATICAAAIAMPGSGRAAVTLRVAASFPATGVAVGKVLIPWTKKVQEESGGELKLDGFWGGSLGANPSKQYQMLRDGVADIVYFYPSYTPGRFPDYGAFELPYLVRSAEEGSVAAWRMYEKGMLEGLDDTHVIGMWVQDPALLHTRVAVQSLSDMKGLKLRAGSSSQGDFLKFVGAIPVGIPTTEMAQAINRGIVEGGVFSWGGLIVFRLSDVVTHHYWLPLGTNVQVLGILKTRWNGLTGKAKKAISQNGGEYLARFAGKAFDSFASRAIARVEKGGKHAIVKVLDNEVAADMKSAQPLYNSWAKSAKNGAAKFAVLQRILADIRAGK